MASVNQTRPHCVNQMGKAYSKPLAARHGRGTAWVRHGHGMLCVNRPYLSHLKRSRRLLVLLRPLKWDRLYRNIGTELTLSCVISQKSTDLKNPIVCAQNQLRENSTSNCDFVKFIIFVRDGNCDYMPPAPKKLAKPLLVAEHVRIAWRDVTECSSCCFRWHTCLERAE